jgi:hypothetical protein
MRAICLSFGLLASCAAVSPTPRVAVSTFAPGTPRATVEARTGDATRVRRRDHGQTQAFYEIRLVPDPIRPLRTVDDRPDRIATPPGLAVMVHTQGERDLGGTDLAVEAAGMAIDAVVRKVSDRVEPARAEPEREPPPPRRCRVEVVYDARMRVLHRRIVPLEEERREIESWDEVPGPVK